MRQKQFSQLVEHMKIDAIEQKHLEMKWFNDYKVDELDKIQEKMNPYSPDKKASPLQNANKIFSKGLKQFNQTTFPKYERRSKSIMHFPSRSKLEGMES